MPSMFTSYQREMSRTPSRQRRMKLLASYAPDWIITILLAAVFFSLDKVEGYRRDFSITDTSLRHPFAHHERVPNWALYIICFVAPVLLQPVINLFTVRSLWDFHNSTLGLILGLSLTGAVTQIVKITVGRPRPDVISRCMPLPGVVDPEYGLTTSAVCTTTDIAVLRDGFRSFPSGHSSLSFAGLGFLSFYLAGKLHLFDERGHAGKAWISLAPLAGAALVAISRTMDFRHHWQDVLVGSILGLIMSFFAYRQYYPSLSSPFSHKPFSPRIPKSAPNTSADGLPTTMNTNNTNNSHIRVGAIDPDNDNDNYNDRESEDSDSSQRKLNVTHPPMPRMNTLSRPTSSKNQYNNKTSHGVMAVSAAEGMGSRQSSPNSGSGKANAYGYGRYDESGGVDRRTEHVELAGTVVRHDLDLSDMYEGEGRQRENDSLV